MCYKTEHIMCQQQSRTISLTYRTPSLILTSRKSVFFSDIRSLAIRTKDNSRLFHVLTMSEGLMLTAMEIENTQR
jgi:hypothetical protein